MAKCIQCGKEFEPYKVLEDCFSCNDGEYIGEDFEGDPIIQRCPRCGGSGSLDYIESKICPSCKAKIEDFFELEEEEY